MIRLFQHAITDARSELGDTFSGAYSYEQSDMLRYAVEGVREAWRQRPSSRYDVDTGLLYDPSAVLPVTDDDTLPIPLEDRLYAALVKFIVYRCLSRDITDTGNANVAAAAKAEFDTIVRG